MADKTEIAWCDSTFNPWIGCTQISPGCDHCYAKADFDDRKGRATWGAGNPRSRTSADNWKNPVRWNKAHAEFFAQHGRRRRVFCASLADVFDNEVPDAWRVDLFALIAATPNLDWLLLTKRIGNVSRMLGDYRTVPLLPNIWLGASIVNNTEAQRDIGKLLAVPARVRFLSMEPLLGPVDLVPYIHCDVGNAIDWVICGGESGPKARPMHPEWARSVRDQCAAAGVPFLFKQWGEFFPVDQYREPGAVIVEPRTGHAWDDGTESWHIGKAQSGRLLDNCIHNEFPGADGREG